MLTAVEFTALPRLQQLPNLRYTREACSPRRSLGEGGSLRQIQRGDVDFVYVAQSVARTVQLLQKLFVAQPFLQRLIGEAAVAGEEKPFPIRRNFR